MLKAYKQAIDVALEHAQWARATHILNADEIFIEIASVFEEKRVGGKIMFIGNGGSAAIADHMANDYTNAGKMRAVSFNDGAVLTCLANDYGFEEVFSQAIKYHAEHDDVLVAISSSGKSLNILNGVKAAKERGCTVVTLSGFGEDNPLRSLGHFNIYVPAPRYGTVEIAHYMILHALLDHLERRP